MAQDSERVVGDLCSVLVLNNTQLELVGLVQADVVGCCECIHLFAMHGVGPTVGGISGWLWQVELILIGK